MSDNTPITWIGIYPIITVVGYDIAGGPPPHTHIIFHFTEYKIINSDFGASHFRARVITALVVLTDLTTGLETSRGRHHWSFTFARYPELTFIDLIVYCIKDFIITEFGPLLVEEDN